MARMIKQPPMIYLYGLVLSNRARIEYTEDGIVISGIIEKEIDCEPGRVQDWCFVPRQLDLPRVVM